MSCYTRRMLAAVLWSFSVVTPYSLAAISPPALVRAVPRPIPKRRSHDDGSVAPGLQMGAGPTAVAVVALMIAIVGRAVRRRRPARSLDDT